MADDVDGVFFVYCLFCTDTYICIKIPTYSAALHTPTHICSFPRQSPLLPQG